MTDSESINQQAGRYARQAMESICRDLGARAVVVVIDWGDEGNSTPGRQAAYWGDEYGPIRPDCLAAVSGGIQQTLKVLDYQYRMAAQCLGCLQDKLSERRQELYKLERRVHEQQHAESAKPRLAWPPAETEEVLSADST